ncbi:hypothetical protein R1sor_008478 [Riccia sorocarpa]|uniref:SigF-like NTF2-like domain-containing protein n=1 Tax=Riccia sorocarpa TaxID=122646 RepID=A0ABD3HX25_9MARC
MEDPEREAPLMFKTLLTRPTFKVMGDTIRKYFTEDVAFHHFLIAVTPSAGIRVYTLTFQLALFFINYQSVLIRDVIWDEKKNLIAIRMDIKTNPWIMLWRTLNLHILLELEFRDVKDENTGKVLKKVKVHRDYFLWSPIIEAIPIIGDIYDSEKPRYIVAEVTAFFIELFVRAYNLLVPAKLREAAFEFWREFLQVPLAEQHGVSIHKAVD